MEGRVLLIEDHNGNRELLSQQFIEEGLEVAEATSGADGLKTAARFMPQVILISTSLPDMSGLEVARRLREINRTKHTFLMLFGDKENRQERIASLEGGANDFIDSPLDPELVALRVRNAINRKNLENITDPTTGLPAGRQVHDELLSLLRIPEGNWALMHFHILKLDPFRETYGFVAGEKLLHSTARILAEALVHDEIENDFIGYGGHDDFIIITHQERSAALEAEVQAAFAQSLTDHYGEEAYAQGYIEIDGREHPLATLRVRCVTPADGPFYDIRSLSEAIAG
ncbi:MAG: response regulator [Anaerolineae bacterium]|nr:response regulator [Anaerolineae bacterium]